MIRRWREPIMSEAEILEHLFSIYDRYWTIVQWWASVSFGVIMIAYFAADKLRAILLITVLALYVIYSAWVFMLLMYNVDIAYGLFEDLGALSRTGELETQGARVALENSFVNYGTRLGMVALPATFLACIGYLLYAYSQVRKSKSS
ncbi:MAG: hypothetical protein CME59_11510 [Halioglobus sp.]|nr:hypothetical protein [Halioglobus sp.]